ncbi:MAG: hypothetical protein IJP65_03435 [Bacteroidales bacterium]|nr:hypothetical protein [Bacteroidales bacterium]
MNRNPLTGFSGEAESQAFGRLIGALIQFNDHRRAISRLGKQGRTRAKRTLSSEVVVGRHLDAFPNGGSVVGREEQGVEDDNGDASEKRDEYRFARHAPSSANSVIAFCVCCGC